MALPMDQRPKMEMANASDTPLERQQGEIIVVDEKVGTDKNPPQTENTTHQSDGNPKQRRAFCSPLVAFLAVLGSMFAGILTLTAYAGQGMSKFYWHIPVLYGDRTTREWPEITGFKSGCSAGGKSLAYGFYDGITGVFTLPYRGAKGAGVKGLGIGILHGIGGLLFKPLSGLWGFIGHPIFGLHKHVSNRKERRQQQEPSSPV